MLFTGYQMGFGSGGYFANTVNFDGTNDFLARGADLTGNSDGKTGTISFWFNTATAGTLSIVGSEEERFQVRLFPAEEISLLGASAADATVLLIKTTSTGLDDGAWHHFIATWDLSATTSDIYLDDASDQTSTTNTDTDIDYTQTDWIIGAKNAAGDEKWNGCIADLWFDLNGLAIATTANRRKFITAGKKPVDLGPTGAVPTGTSPILYLSGFTNTWHTNKGTGGGLTETGALTDCATRP